MEKSHGGRKSSFMLPKELALKEIEKIKATDKLLDEIIARTKLSIVNTNEKKKVVYM
jgi:hypothetical protein